MAKMRDRKSFTIFEGKLFTASIIRINRYLTQVTSDMIRRFGVLSTKLD